MNINGELKQADSIGDGMKCEDSGTIKKRDNWMLKLDEVHERKKRGIRRDYRIFQLGN